MIISGGEWPSAGTPRAAALHLLRTRNALAVASNFQAEGIVPVVDDVLTLPDHARLVIEAGVTHLFGLTAAWDAVLSRDAKRGKQTPRLYEDAEAQIRLVLPFARWIDTSELEPVDVAARILEVLVG